MLLIANILAMSEKMRRLMALVVALTLVVAGATHVVQASDMAVKMSTASASDMPSSGGCGGCDSNDDMQKGCFALCGINVAAILPSPALAPAVTAVSLAVPTFAAISGDHGPPELSPPRTIGMN